MYLSIYLSIYLSVCLFVCLSVLLSICKLENQAILRDFFIFQSWQHQKCSNSARLPRFFKVDNIKNEAILRDFLNVCTWQRQNRSKSARLPHISKLTTSKTKQFCETSSFFELDNIQNEATLRDFFNFWTWQHQKTKQFCETSLKNGKLTAALTASYQCVLRFFHSTRLKYCACHEKVMPGHTKCCTCHSKSSQQTWRSDAPKCNPSQEISALTS